MAYAGEVIGKFYFCNKAHKLQILIFMKYNEQNNLVKSIDCQEISGTFIRSIIVNQVRMYNLSWFSGDEDDRSQRTSA